MGHNPGHAPSGDRPGSHDAVVLGAGPAGAGLAYYAARAGRRVALVERAERPGGAAGSFEVAGARVDHGSHRLHPSVDPAILADLHLLLGPDLQRRRRHGRIRLAGRWVAFPLRALDLVRHLPPGFAAAAAADAIRSPWRRPPRADTYAEVLRAGLGPAICEAFYFPYARKLWGVEPEELSGEQARRRVGARSPAALLSRLVPARRADPDAGTFWYPRRGFGQIAERLAEAAGAAGAEVRFGAEVVRVGLGNAGACVATADGEVLEARRLFSTIPLPALARLADPPPPAPVLAAAGRLRSRAVVLVYLVLGTGRYTEYDAHYFPGADAPLSRLSEPANYGAGAPPGRTVLCAELPCERDDATWAADDAALGAAVAAALPAQGLPAVAPLAVEVRRLAAAYPVYRVGYEADFAAVDAWASRGPVVSFGRQGLFAHDNTHHALAMARDAAAALGPGGAFDAAAWSAARERFARHVVED